MGEILLEVIEKYRCVSEEQAKNLIEESKNSSEYELKKYNVDNKELKSKGEVIEEYSILTLTKQYSDLKEINKSLIDNAE